mmetsp:Transcript_22439/g.34059  ORF Transcript_22439/g.34059 Transcript_22439/m.34059 type:complete len:187 (-) Transcript_22439:447-1007(-)
MERFFPSLTFVIFVLGLVGHKSFAPQTCNKGGRNIIASLSHDNHDVEKMRHHLETLINKDNDGITDQERSEINSAPLLSSMGREIRKAEISLIKELEDCDEAMTELWNLWYSERGPEATRELKSIEKMMDDRSQWGEVERRLKALMKEHSVHWVEPMNRLAILCYLEGRFEESKELYRGVLEQKPW